MVTVPMKNSKKSAMEVGIRLTGDQRAVENLILDVRAIAQRCGLEIPNIQVIRQPKIGPASRKKKVTSKTST